MPARPQWPTTKKLKTLDINNTNVPQKKHRLGTVSKNILLKGLNQFHSAYLTLSSDKKEKKDSKVST